MNQRGGSVAKLTSIARKYGLYGFEGRLANELSLMEGTNFVMQMYVDLQKLTVGNLSTYTKNIDDKGVRELLRNFKSDYRPIGSASYGN